MVMIRGYLLNIQEKQRIWDFADTGKNVRLLGEMPVPDDMYYISDIDIKDIVENSDFNRHVSVYIKNGDNPIPTGYLVRVNRNLKRASIFRRVQKG